MSHFQQRVVKSVSSRKAHPGQGRSASHRERSKESKVNRGRE